MYIYIDIDIDIDIDIIKLPYISLYHSILYIPIRFSAVASLVRSTCYSS